MRFQPRSAKIRRVSAGIARELGELRLRPLEHGYAAREIERLLTVQPGDTGMCVVGGPKAELGFVLLVVLVDLVDLEHGDRTSRLVDEPDALARRSRIHGQADGKRPGQTTREMHPFDHELVVGPTHEPFERRERAGRDHVEVGKLARCELDLLEPVEIVGTIAGPVDQRAAMRGDQPIRRRDAHGPTSVAP